MELCERLIAAGVPDGLRLEKIDSGDQHSHQVMLCVLRPLTSATLASVISPCVWDQWVVSCAELHRAGFRLLKSASSGCSTTPSDRYCCSDQTSALDEVCKAMAPVHTIWGAWTGRTLLGLWKLQGLRGLA